jgi:hypothetical protein
MAYLEEILPQIRKGQKDCGMNEIRLTTENFVQFLRENPQTRLHALPEKYFRTDSPMLIVSHELFQKIWESVYNDKELTDERD